MRLLWTDLFRQDQWPETPSEERKGREATFKQVFATGDAAPYIAMRPEIRNKVGIYLLPLDDEGKRAFVKADKRITDIAEAQEQANRIQSLLGDIAELKGAEVLTAEKSLPDPTGDPLAKITGDKISKSRKSSGAAAKKALRMRTFYYENDAIFDKLEAAVKAAKKK